jgi:hypothetical protein
MFGDSYNLADLDLIETLRSALLDLGRVERTPRKDSATSWAAMIRAFDEAGVPMTVRQVYYALVSMGAIPKTEAAYGRVCYHLLALRRLGVIPYEFIADNTRWMRKPDTYQGLDQFLEITKQTYRRMLWADQDVYLEVWIEKDALAGVFYGVTAPWDVPLMVTRGYPSESFLYEAAEALKAQDKPTHIYYFGDYDPSGQNIAQTTAEKLRGFGASFTFHNYAVTPDQIREMNLPTRPTKRTDSRAKGWDGGSVELDAIPPKRLRAMVRDVITGWIDPETYQRTREAEALERETLDQVINTLG